MDSRYYDAYYDFRRIAFEHPHILNRLNKPELETIHRVLGINRNIQSQRAIARLDKTTQKVVFRTFNRGMEKLRRGHSMERFLEIARRKA
ncbi:MAG: hypothetical protein ABH863_04095 [Candidatus Micrarchaeota archaeon]